MTASCTYVTKVIKELVAQNKYQEAITMLFRFYELAAPKMFEVAVSTLTTDELKLEHLNEVVQEGIYLWLPQNTPGIGSENILKLKQEFPLPRKCVTYIDDGGVKRKTVKPVLYGSLYMVALEKIGDDWGATSIPRRQHHGIPGKLTDGDKNTLPWRDQAFKIFGESEVRLLMGTLDPEFVASVVNFPNNPAMCMDVAYSILTASKPTNIYMATDYQKYAALPGRATQYFNHILETTGVNIVRGEKS